MPLMLRYLLDTNIFIYVLKRCPPEVLSVFNANAHRTAISSTFKKSIKYYLMACGLIRDNWALLGVLLVLCFVPIPFKSPIMS